MSSEWWVEGEWWWLREENSVACSGGGRSEVVGASSCISGVLEIDVKIRRGTTGVGGWCECIVRFSS